MEYNTMLRILECLLVGVCLVTTAFPLWYGFFNRWWETKAGISIMLTSATLATAWDLTAFLHFWPPDIKSIETYFWIQFTVMAMTIGAGLYLLYALWYNRRHGQMVTVKNGGSNGRDGT